MRRFCSAANLPEAHLLRHLLQQAGIEARVFNENAQGGVGEIPFVHAWPELWLMDEGDLERAQAVLDVFETTDHSATHTCPACRESNPGTFEICWHCGQPL
jgi:hypothetical protein